MSSELVNWIITGIIFATIGLLVAWHRQGRSGPLTFVVLSVVALLGAYVGVGTTLIGVDRYGIILDAAVVTGCVGAAVGLLLRNRELSRNQSA